MEEICSSSSLKRQRGEVGEEEEEVIKRQKSYKDIITLLEEDEDEPTEDLSSLISTLQEEIASSVSSSPSPSPSSSYGPAQQPAHYKPDSSTGSGSEEEEEEDKESVMKHLLHASDDELGLPNTDTSTSNIIMDDGFDDLLQGQVDGGDYFLPIVAGEGLWEFEDHQAANYYSFLESSQIFL